MMKRTVTEREEKINEQTNLGFEIHGMTGQMTELFNLNKDSFMKCFAEYDYYIMSNKNEFEIIVKNQLTDTIRSCKSPEELKNALMNGYKILSSYSNLYKTRNRSRRDSKVDLASKGSKKTV